MKPRIAIAGFQHETNTFVPIPTPYEDFVRGGAWPAMTHGDEVISVFSGSKLPIGGFIDAATDWDLVPILWAGSEPSGYVSQAAFDRIAAMICDGIQKAYPVDGIYLDLHGAMVCEHYEDGEGELLRRLRAAFGPDLPIVVSLDLHGNLTPQFFERASAVTIYRTYPHIDMAETGARAKALMETRLQRGKDFARAYAQLDFIVPIQEQSTRRDPGARLYGMLDSLEGGGVDSVDFAFGFPPADIEHCGISVFAYGSDQADVDGARDRMVDALNAAEPEFDNPLVPAAEAVRRAIALAGTATRPVVLCDPQDNPGAGATGETTGLLTAMVDGGARSACLAMLWDPDTAQAAHAAGLDGEFNAAIGGLFPEIGGSPLAARVQVLALSDGDFVFTGPMFGGLHAQLGPMAALRILDGESDVTVIVGSRRAQNADQAMITHLGLDPLDYKILGIKSAVHFLADYEPIAETVIFAEAPGANPCRLDNIAYTRLRPGVRLGGGG